MCHQLHFILRFIRYLFETTKALTDLTAETSTVLNQNTLLGTRVSAIEAKLESTVEQQCIEFARREEETDGRLNET
jgi:hypothetical protein